MADNKAVVLKAPKDLAKKIGNLFDNPLKDAREFFTILGGVMVHDVDITFRQLGARAGHPAWPGFSLLTLHPSWKAVNSSFPTVKGYRYNPSKWNKRMGGGKSKRYSNSSKMLESGGTFHKSFQIKQITNQSVSVGTNLSYAKARMQGPPEREVLFFTSSDRMNYQRLFIGWLDRKIISKSGRVIR